MKRLRKIFRALRGKKQTKPSAENMIKNEQITPGADQYGQMQPGNGGSPYKHPGFLVDQNGNKVNTPAPGVYGSPILQQHARAKQNTRLQQTAQPQPDSRLQRMLRHSMLEDWANARQEYNQYLENRTVSAAFPFVTAFYDNEALAKYEVAKKTALSAPGLKSDVLDIVDKNLNTIGVLPELMQKAGSEEGKLAIAEECLDQVLEQYEYKLLNKKAPIYDKIPVLEEMPIYDRVPDLDADATSANDDEAEEKPDNKPRW